MAVPRPILLALLGTVLLAATFMATRSSKTGSEKVATPAAQAPAKASAPAQPGKPPVLSAPDAVRALIAPGTPVKSARLQIRFTSQSLGGRHEREVARLSGSFTRAPAGGLASFDLDTNVRDDGRRSKNHFVSTGDRGFVGNGSQRELSARNIRNSKLALSAIAKGGPAVAKLPTLDPSTWMKGMKAESGGTVAGVPTTHVSGRVDFKRVAADVKQMTAAFSRASASPVKLPAGFGGKLEQALKTARLDAYVGTQDKVLRRLRLTAVGTLPKQLLDKGETPRWRHVLSVSLTDVNKTQRAAAPAKPLKPSPAVRKSAGDFLVLAALVNPPASASQTALGFYALSKRIDARRTPSAVERAVRAHRKVVLFFTQARSVDDPITARAVVSLRRHTKASIYTDSIDNLAAYGQVVQSVGVTRAPSIVIIGRKGRARLVDGYIDPAALAQEVSDTR